jgi:predicted dehydrogenase
LRIVNGPLQRYIDAGCAWMADATFAGGGALRNLGIHAADAILRCFPNQRIDLLGAALVPDATHDVEIFAVATILVDRRIPVTIEVGYTFPDPDSGMGRHGDAEWRLATSTGYLVERGGSLSVNRSFGIEITEPSLPESIKYERFAGEVLDAWQRGEPSPIPLDDCARAARLIDRIYDQAVTAQLAGDARA